MIPARSTCEPIMNPGTSARNTSGTLNASHSQMKRAALSAESTNSTPPRCFGLFARIPTGEPSSRAKPMMISRAHSGFSSKKEPSSTSASRTWCMSYARRSSTGAPTSGKEVDLVGDTRAGGVDEVDDRELVPERVLRESHDLLDGTRAPRARLDGGVVRHHAYRTTVDPSGTGDHTVGGKITGQ